MGQESDDIVSLPAPPPPNPAARRSSIDTALRKFDGIEESAEARPARQSPWQWASTHRRATGGLVTAALIAVVGIPAIQVALRNQPAEVASERSQPALPSADVEPVQDNAAAPAAAKPPADQPATLPVARNEPVEAPAEPPASQPREKRADFAVQDSTQKSREANAAPMLSSQAPSAVMAPAAPLPPPRLPPAPSAPMAERKAADSAAAAEAEADNITVTGQLARRQNMGAATRAPAVASEGAEADFHEKLQTAFRANNRRAMLALVALPLRVQFNGDTRTYRTRSDVERDYDRIFTSEVRESVLSGQVGRHLRYAPICSRQPCAPGSAVKITAVRP